MPAKLTTTINKIQKVPNPSNAEIIGEFYQYLKSSDVSENHQNNCLKVVLALAKPMINVIVVTIIMSSKLFLAIVWIFTAPNNINRTIQV
jgi:hypothetical protein